MAIYANVKSSVESKSLSQASYSVAVMCHQILAARLSEASKHERSTPSNYLLIRNPRLRSKSVRCCRRNDMVLDRALDGPG